MKVTESRLSDFSFFLYLWACWEICPSMFLFFCIHRWLKWWLKVIFYLYTNPRAQRLWKYLCWKALSLHTFPLEASKYWPMQGKLRNSLFLQARSKKSTQKYPKKSAKHLSSTVFPKPHGIHLFPQFSVGFPQICWVVLPEMLPLGISGNSVGLGQFSISAFQPSPWWCWMWKQWHLGHLRVLMRVWHCFHVVSLWARA